MIGGVKLDFHIIIMPLLPLGSLHIYSEAGHVNFSEGACVYLWSHATQFYASSLLRRSHLDLFLLKMYLMNLYPTFLLTVAIKQ